MERIKRFITCNVPVKVCNFRCTYCYLGQYSNVDNYRGGISQFVLEPKKIAKSLSPQRLGGICHFNFCASGETMLHPQLIELISELTKMGHYVDVVTNGTLSNKIEELIRTLDDKQRKRCFIKFSFHYLELKKNNMMDIFVSNINKIKESKISYTIEITPCDELVPHIDNIKEFSIKQFGALPHISIARNESVKGIAMLTKYSKEEYKKIWSTFESELFNFKMSIFGKKMKQFCYAGEWSLNVMLEDGSYWQCYLGNKLGNICDMDKPIHFCPIGRCKEPHCYNGHAFLAFGNIPSIGNDINYAIERDRITESGEHWLQPDIYKFFSDKCSNNNKQLSDRDKRKIIRKNNRIFYLNKIKNKLVRE